MQTSPVIAATDAPECYPKTASMPTMESPFHHPPARTCTTSYPQPNYTSFHLPNRLQSSYNPLKIARP